MEPSRLDDYHCLRRIQLQASQNDRDKVFVVSDIHPEGDEKVGFALMDTVNKLLDALGISKSSEDIHSSKSFCNQ